MPFKIGGGNKLQWYDISDGEYAECEANSNFKDSYLKTITKNLDDYVLGLHEDIAKIHFPNYQVSDIEYCKKFVDTFKSNFYKDLDSVPFAKCEYLMTYHKENDKSMFLEELGYHSSDAIHMMLNDVINFDNSVFNRIDVHGLSISVKTLIPNQSGQGKDKYVDTIWIVDKNLRARFITMIIGGKKYGN